MVGRGNQTGSGAGEIFLFKNQRALQDHFHLGSALDVHIGAAGKKGNEGDGGNTRANARQAAGEGVPAGDAGDGTNGSAGGNGNFGGFAGIAALVRVLLNGSLAVVLYCLLACAREAVDDAGISTTVPLGKMMEVKCMSSWDLPLTCPARTTRSTTPCT